jgi:hypothetical protein
MATVFERKLQWFQESVHHLLSLGTLLIPALIASLPEVQAPSGARTEAQERDHKVAPFNPFLGQFSALRAMVIGEPIANSQ